MHRLARRCRAGADRLPRPHDRFCFSIDRKNQWFLRFLEVLHELPRIAPERRHGLNVFFDVKHIDLTLE